MILVKSYLEFLNELVLRRLWDPGGGNVLFLLFKLRSGTLLRDTDEGH